LASQISLVADPEGPFDLRLLFLHQLRVARLLCRGEVIRQGSGRVVTLSQKPSVFSHAPTHFTAWVEQVMRVVVGRLILQVPILSNRLTEVLNGLIGMMRVLLRQRNNVVFDGYAVLLLAE